MITILTENRLPLVGKGRPASIFIVSGVNGDAFVVVGVWRIEETCQKSSASRGNPGAASCSTIGFSSQRRGTGPSPPPQ